ncbi:MAG: VWA domain-containing protein [Rhodospirillales bacterium]|nr:VWA domain-containing protein [Rhodospirillales bacterium]
MGRDVSHSGTRLPETSADSEVDAFLSRMKMRSNSGGGRLIFALDATASRQPSWDRASHLQAEMFQAAHALGGLSVQLLFYRGYRECKASPWLEDSGELLRRMTSVSCSAGHTQIARILRHAAKETGKAKVDALVFVGDALEEMIDDLGDAAGALGLLGLPCFMFQEGNNPRVRRAFEEVAKLSGGACCHFDARSAQQLRDLLGAVAAYAAGGRRALLDYGAKRGAAVALLTRQLR